MPPEAAATIDRYLNAITRDQESERTVIHGFVEFGIGYDSNVNSATADSLVAIPAFGGLIFSLAPSATKVDDVFISFGGGVGIQHPVSKQLTMFGAVAYQNKTNTHEDEFSTSYFDFNLGLSYRLNRETFMVAAQYNSFFVDNSQLYSDAYRNASGITAQWQHDFDSRNQISAFLQYSDMVYPTQEIRDANRYIGGAAMPTHSAAERLSPT